MRPMAKSTIACIASVSVGLGSKERPRNGTGLVFCPCEIGARAKIRKRGGRGEGRKGLRTNPWILKISVRQRTELVSGWTSQTLLTCVDRRIKKGKLVYKHFSPNETLVVSFDGTVEIL